MTKVIVNLRGTSGSGKTTVARSFIKRYPSQTFGKKGVRVDVPNWRHPLFLIGKYDAVCGGMDTVSTQQECADLCVKAYQMGHVMCEGLLVSGVGPKGTLPAALIEAAGDNALFLFLDTPLAVCIDRVQGRREAKGNNKPLNPANTEAKWNQTRRSFELMQEAGKKAFWVNYEQAFDQVFRTFEKADARN